MRLWVNCLRLFVLTLGLLSLSVTAVSGVYAIPENLASVNGLLLALDSGGAARAAEAKTGGKVLSVTKEERNGRIVFRVKVLLPEGRIKNVFIEGGNGSENGG